MEKYLSGEDISVSEIKKVIRKAVLTTGFFPVCCGTAFKNKGVQLLLDAIVDYMPSPMDIPPVIAHDDREREVEISSEDPRLSALVFKIMTDPFVGELAFVRVYSGELRSGDMVYNSSAGKAERIGRLLRMHANKREETDVISSGNIGAVVGLKYAITGSTLCTKNDQFVLESMQFPEPVIHVAIEPKTKVDSDRLSMSLGKLAKEDPSFKVKTDEETGQTIISGMGELHLEILVERLRREFKVDANVGRPQVSYREKFAGPISFAYKHQKQTGGKGQFANVVIEFEPNENGGVVFENKIKGGVIPGEFISSVEYGIKAAAASGVHGYPVVDVKATLVDGSAHEVDSSDTAFKIAAIQCFKKAEEKAGVILLEPLMGVDVTIPEDYTGDVLSDIQSRRGTVLGMEDDENSGARTVKSLVPLSEMFGYSTDLRSKTQGRGVFTMQFAKYGEVPAKIRERIYG